MRHTHSTARCSAHRAHIPADFTRAPTRAHAGNPTIPGATAHASVLAHQPATAHTVHLAKHALNSTVLSAPRTNQCDRRTHRAHAAHTVRTPQQLHTYRRLYPCTNQSARGQSYDTGRDRAHNQSSRINQRPHTPRTHTADFTRAPTRAHAGNPTIPGATVHTTRARASTSGRTHRASCDTRTQQRGAQRTAHTYRRLYPCTNQSTRGQSYDTGCDRAHNQCSRINQRPHTPCILRHTHSTARCSAHRAHIPPTLPVHQPEHTRAILRYRARPRARISARASTSNRTHRASCDTRTQQHGAQRTAHQPVRPPHTPCTHPSRYTHTADFTRAPTRAHAGNPTIPGATAHQPVRPPHTPCARRTHRASCETHTQQHGAQHTAHQPVRPPHTPCARRTHRAHTPAATHIPPTLPVHQPERTRAILRYRARPRA